MSESEVVDLIDVVAVMNIEYVSGTKITSVQRLREISDCALLKVTCTEKLIMSFVNNIQSDPEYPLIDDLNRLVSEYVGFSMNIRLNSFMADLSNVLTSKQPLASDQERTLLFPILNLHYNSRPMPIAMADIVDRIDDRPIYLSLLAMVLRQYEGQYDEAHGEILNRLYDHNLSEIGR